MTQHVLISKLKYFKEKTERSPGTGLRSVFDLMTARCS
jgi:hypothetical protein